MHQPKRPFKLYGFALSGHCHRVELFLSLLGLPYEWVEVDLKQGEQKQPAFLSLNPFGQVPVLVDGDEVVADSNAILLYVAQRYGPGGKWWPNAIADQARVQRWLSVAAGPLAYNFAAARLVGLFKAPMDPVPLIERSHQWLKRYDEALAESAFLAADYATIADIATYTYVAHAPDGGIALNDYPAVRAWLARIESLPGFIPMRINGVGLS